MPVRTNGTPASVIAAYTVTFWGLIHLFLQHLRVIYWGNKFNALSTTLHIACGVPIAALAVCYFWAVPPKNEEDGEKWVGLCFGLAQFGGLSLWNIASYDTRSSKVQRFRHSRHSNLSRERLLHHFQAFSAFYLDNLLPNFVWLQPLSIITIHGSTLWHSDRYVQAPMSCFVKACAPQRIKDCDSASSCWLG